MLEEHNIDVSLADYLYKYLDNLDNYKDAINELINGKPVQYIVGNVNFYGINLKVNEYTLIPRFETEQLVEKTIDYINEYFDEKISIADLGTGTGAIAITLKKYINSNIDAVDISKEALEIAKLNATNNDVRVNFYEGNMLSPLSNKYDVIISNPPYISKDEQIEDIVKNNEPYTALYAPNEGLYYYEEILKNASNYLNKKSIIAFEIGYKQGNKIKEYAKKYFPDAIIKLEKDLQDKDRFIFIFNGI